MDWNYVSGFFDADGSISYIRAGAKESKTIQVSFSNTEKVILKRIQSFIEAELQIKGHIVLKPARKATHNDSYDLRYTHNRGVQVIKRIHSLHPKKRHRKNVLLKIQKLKPKNGQYTDEMRTQIMDLEKLYK